MPLNANEILSRLPSVSTSSESEVQFVVSEAFIEHLKVLRYGNEELQPKVRRKKMSVEPGKSVIDTIEQTRGWLVGWLSGGFTPCRHLRPSSGREHTITQLQNQDHRMLIQNQGHHVLTHQKMSPVPMIPEGYAVMRVILVSIDCYFCIEMAFQLLHRHFHTP